MGLRHLVNKNWGDDAGSATISFVFAVVSLSALTLILVQTIIIMHTKTMLTEAAIQSAQYAGRNGGHEDLTKQRADWFLNGSIASPKDTKVELKVNQGGSERIVEVEITARLPMVFFWGPSGKLKAVGHAYVEEVR